MRFVFDLDDTICETDKYSEEYMLKFFKEHNFPYKLVDKIARYADGKFNWNEETAQKWYQNYGDAMNLELPIKNNAVKVVNLLYKMGHTIIICTARDKAWFGNPELVTKKWLENVGLKYHYLILGRRDKENVCKELNADVFVDDDLEITLNVANYFKSTNNKNKISFLSTTEYNKDKVVPENVKRLNNFEELLNL